MLWIIIEPFIPLASELLWTLACVGAIRAKVQRVWYHCHLNGVLLTSIVERTMTTITLVGRHMNMWGNCIMYIHRVACILYCTFCSPCCQFLEAWDGVYEGAPKTGQVHCYHDLLRHFKVWQPPFISFLFSLLFSFFPTTYVVEGLSLKVAMTILMVSL